MQQLQQKSLKDALQPKYIFGYRGDFKNNLLQHSVTNKFIYPAANAIVIFDSENKSQTIIPALPGSRGITCMAVSPNKRYVAWSEECETGIIVVLDTKNGKMRTLSTLDCKSRSYVSLDFWPYQDSAETTNEKTKKVSGKFLVSLSSPPEQMLIHWQWEKQKCLGSCIINTKGDNFRYYHIFFHPKEDDFVCVVGNGAIKLYKLIIDNPPKQKDSPFQKKKEIKETQHSNNFLSYCILSDGKTMVIGTDQGEILYFNENCEFKLVLPTSPGEGYSIDCMVKYQNGFIVGGADFTIYIYRKHEGDLKNPYIRVDRKIQNKQFPNNKIVALLLSQNEDTLYIGVDSGQIYSIPFSADREAVQDDSKYDYLLCNFHTETITGMDVSVRKSLIATASLDKSVRIWNYAEPSLELVSEFEDQPFSVAFHPSGFHLIVTFLDRIVLYNILEFDLQSFKEIHIKGCQLIKFSHGGHLFGIANSNIVQVYQFYTGENPQNYVFKQQSGKIQAIEWDLDDLGFYTGANDGYVYYWKLDDSQNKNQIFYIPQFNVDTLAIGHVDQYVYIAGSSDPLNVYEVHVSNKPPKDNLMDNTRKVFPSEPKKIQTNCQISKMALTNSEKLFFFATSQKPGGIRIANYPFTKDNSEVQELAVHHTEVTQLKVSFDDNQVFTVGKDGSLVIYLLDEYYRIKLNKDGMAAQQAEEFLIQRDKYKKKIQKIETLKAQIKDFEWKQKIKSNLYTKEKDENIRVLQEQIDAVENLEKNKYDSLFREKQHLERQFEEQKRTLQLQHETNKKTTEADFKQKMQLEQQRFEELLKEKNNQLIAYQTFVANFKSNQANIEKQKRAHYEELLKQEKDLYEQLLKDKEDLKQRYTAERNKLEDQAEDDIEKLKEANEAQMKILSDELDKAELEKKAKQSEFDTAAQQLEAANSKQKEILEDIQQNQETNKQYLKEKESHAKEIEEREKTIRDKAKRIYELKKKTQELEKFKFVLDYKIKELKREQGPREEEITKMKEQISNMQSEILHFKQINANLGLIVTDLNLRQSGMKQEIDDQAVIIEQHLQYIKAFEYDISEANTTLNDFKKLKVQMLKLFNKYVQSDSTKKKFESIDPQKEFIKERAHLETTNKSLKEKFSKKLRVHKQDNNRIMNQNVDLISEINDLKREIKMLTDDAKLKENQAKRAGEKSEEEMNRDIENNEQEITQMKQRLMELRQQAMQRRNIQHEISDSEGPHPY